MNLYKYLPPSRVDVIQDCMIRFTQYGDFNDPFELNPNINGLAEEQEIRNLVDKDFVKLIEEEYSKHPIINAFISKESFIRLAECQKENIKDRVIGMERQLVELLPAMLQKTTNSLLGALSLSEIRNHKLMWSHYADEHRGYAIGFNVAHPFFIQTKTDVDELRHLKKVGYRERPPAINLMNTSGEELFFVKSLEWEYESEWRMLMPLVDSSKVIERQPYAIHLFSFPIESVSEVILGARMSDEAKVVIKTLMHDKKYEHVQLYQANLDSASFDILIQPSLKSA